MQVSLFNGFTDKNPKPITIREVVEIIRADQRLQVLTENHRRYRAAGDTARADAEKQHMPCFSVAVQFSGGKQQKHITAFTGMGIVDLDHVKPEDMPRVLALVRQDSHTLLAYTTISNHGVRVIYRYEINDGVNDNLRATLGTPSRLRRTPSINRGRVSGAPSHPEGEHQQTPPLFIEGVPGGRGSSKQSAEQYKQVFEHGNRYYSELVGMESDGQCKNATRLSGMAHDPEVYYNPEAVAFVIEPEEKNAVGRPRKGTKVERVEATVLRELEQRGVVYGPGTHNKYISDACYMMNRYGVSLDDCTKWALEKFSDYNEAGNNVPSIVRSCYTQTDEHGTVRLPKAEKESRYASIKDIQEWLRSNDIRIRHNVITRKREIASPNPSQGGVTTIESTEKLTAISESPLLGRGRGEATELTDQHVNSLYCRFCLDTGRQAKISDFYIIIESDFYPEYHPLKEYLESLPAWDGVTDHIDRLASTVHVTGCTQELHNRFFKKWMVAMVAAWLDDGTTNHEILTYIGEQGKYKTSFMTHLLPPELDKYFAIKHFNHTMSKDDRLALTELALIDLEELDNMRPEAVNLLKAITTDPAINLRPVWERYALRRQHIASFCGTGNNPHFLTDLSGNRRWLPFMVSGIDSPWEQSYDYAGLYAQAYALYSEGFRYWFDDEENAELERHNRQFEEPNMEEELILTYLRQPYGDEAGEFLTATRIIELIGMYVKRPLSAKRVAFAMRRLGFEQRRTKSARGWNVVLLTGDDIKNAQRQNARMSDTQ